MWEEDIGVNEHCRRDRVSGVVDSLASGHCIGSECDIGSFSRATGRDCYLLGQYQCDAIECFFFSFVLQVS